jgi:hypothetical protein
MIEKPTFHWIQASCAMSSDQVMFELVGGLGNQIFQVATAFSHAKRHGKKLKLAKNLHCARPTYWDTWLSSWNEMNIGYIRITDDMTQNDTVFTESSASYAPIPSNTRIARGYF